MFSKEVGLTIELYKGAWQPEDVLLLGASMIVKVRDPDPAYPFISRVWIIENPLSEGLKKKSVTSVQRFHRTFSGMTYQIFPISFKITNNQNSIEIPNILAHRLGYLSGTSYSFMWSGGLVSSGISDIEKRFVEGESKISSGSGFYLYGYEATYTCYTQPAVVRNRCSGLVNLQSKNPYSYHDETETASITSWFIESRLVFPIGPFEIFGGTILYSGGKAKFSSAEKTGARGLMEQVIMPGAISVTSGAQVIW